MLCIQSAFLPRKRVTSLHGATLKNWAQNVLRHIKDAFYFQKQKSARRGEKKISQIAKDVSCHCHDDNFLDNLHSLAHQPFLNYLVSSKMSFIFDLKFLLHTKSVLFWRFIFMKWIKTHGLFWFLELPDLVLSSFRLIFGNFLAILEDFYQRKIIGGSKLMDCFDNQSYQI